MARMLPLLRNLLLPGGVVCESTRPVRIDTECAQNHFARIARAELPA